MARLTYVYRMEDMSYVNVGRRQLPVSAGDDNLMMLMDLNSKGLCIDSPHIRGKELEEFTRKFNLLTTDELHTSLEISSKTFVSVLNQCVQCVGCRRLVERLFYQLSMSGHPTLDPLVLKNSCVLSIAEEKMKTPQALGTLLYRHHEILNNLLESKLRNKTRCVLHSLDAFRSKPFSETWREVWSSMKHNCRDELAVIETKELHEVLENYLKKHKFCNGCRTKIEKAYKILVGETTTKEKGYVAALYANIKKCHPDKHIHVFTNKIDFLDALIRRAEPEVNGR
ncbi:gametogenetin-binding protein 2-like [Musca vetustissima]|uniref:gametogenetin-binding protein 2-like n=1 Tax=Musca vetustissima TaxID=27455 RepID=UPI002AB7CDDB|nr:gametogenetin-binding protein 2-like [Musca vetustissima]